MISKTEKKSAYRWLMQQSRSTQTWISLTIGCSFASGLLFILQASLLAKIIDKAYIHHFSLHNVFIPLFILLGVIIIRAGFSWLREIVSFQASARIRQTVRDELVAHLTRLGPVNAATLATGAISSSAIEHVEALHGFFADYLPQMALAIMIPLAILAFVFPVNWLGGLILLFTAPLIPLFMALIGMGVESINQQHLQTLSRLGAHFLDLLQGLTTLKLFGRSKEQRNIISDVANEYCNKTMSVLRIAFISSAVLELFSSVAIAILAVILGLSLLGKVDIGYYGQHITLYQALFILLLAPEFFLPLRQLSVHYHARAEAIAAAHELQTIFNLPVAEIQSGLLKTTDDYVISFNEVCFAYSKQENLLNNLNLEIKAGEHIAIVGPSGIGKTTLLNLLAGFIQPSSGCIIIKDQDLATLNLTNWWQHIAWLGQNPRLIHGTLRENILLAKPGASNEEIMHAADKAHVSEFAKQLPQGLDTLIGEQNMGLSGGQAQRVALARIYLANKTILLLDEPTASLDTVTEKFVLQALRELAQNKTVITISHRADTIAIASKVYRLEDGKLDLMSNAVNGGKHD